MKLCAKKSIKSNICWINLSIRDITRPICFFLFWSTTKYCVVRPQYVFVYTCVYSVVYGLEHNTSTLFLWSNYFKIDMTLISNVSYHILYLRCYVRHFICIWLFSVQKNTFKNVVIYVEVKKISLSFTSCTYLLK